MSRLSKTISETSHPAWCDQSHCDADAGHADVRHLSMAYSWSSAHDDVRCSLAFYRSDSEGSIGNEGYLLTFEHEAMEHECGCGCGQTFPERVEIHVHNEDFDQLAVARHALDMLLNPRG